ARVSEPLIKGDAQRTHVICIEEEQAGPVLSPPPFGCFHQEPSNPVPTEPLEYRESIDLSTDDPHVLQHLAGRVLHGRYQANGDHARHGTIHLGDERTAFTAACPAEACSDPFGGPGPLRHFDGSRIQPNPESPQVCTEA